MKVCGAIEKFPSWLKGLVIVVFFAYCFFKINLKSREKIRLAEIDAQKEMKIEEEKTKRIKAISKGISGRYKDDTIERELENKIKQSINEIDSEKGTPALNKRLISSLKPKKEEKE